jgi:hypothetical protein
LIISRGTFKFIYKQNIEMFVNRLRKVFSSPASRRILFSSLAASAYLSYTSSTACESSAPSDAESNAYALALKLTKSSGLTDSNGKVDDAEASAHDKASTDLTEQALKALRNINENDADKSSNITGELASRIDELLSRFVELSIEIAEKQEIADLESEANPTAVDDGKSANATALIASLSNERDKVVAEISTLMAPLAEGSSASSTSSLPSTEGGIPFVSAAAASSTTTNAQDMNTENSDAIRIQIAEERARIDDLIASLKTSVDEDSELKQRVSELESSLKQHVVGVKDFAKRATGWAKSAQDKISSSLEGLTLATDKVDAVTSIANGAAQAADAASAIAKTAKAAAITASADAERAQLSAAHAAASAEKACMDASMSRADTAASIDALHMTVAAAQAAAASAKAAEEVARDRAALLAALSTRADLEKQVANDRLEALASSLKAAKAAQSAQAEADLLIAGFEAEKSRSSAEAAAAVRASEVSKRRAAESIERAEAVEATFKQSAFLASQEAAKASADAAKTLNLLKKQEADAREALTQTLLSLQETRRQAEVAVQETLSLATSARTAAAASTEEAVALAIERSAHAAAVADLIAEKAEAQARTVVAEQKLLQARAFEETRVIFDEALQTQELAKVLVAQVESDVAESEAAAKAKADAAIAAAELVAAQAVKDAHEAVTRASKEKKKAETEHRIAETAVDVARYKASKAAALAAAVLAPAASTAISDSSSSSPSSISKAVSIAESLAHASKLPETLIIADGEANKGSTIPAAPTFSYGTILPHEAEYVSRISAQIESKEQDRIRAINAKAEEELEAAIPIILKGMRLRDTPSNRDRAKRYASTFGVKIALASAIEAATQAKKAADQSAVAASATSQTSSFFAPSNLSAVPAEQPTVKKGVTDYASAATSLLRRGSPVDHNEVLAARAEADAEIAAVEAEAAAARAVLARHFATIKDAAAADALVPHPSGPEAYVSTLTHGKLHIAPEPEVSIPTNSLHTSEVTKPSPTPVPGEKEYLSAAIHQWADAAVVDEALPADENVANKPHLAPAVTGTYSADSYAQLVSAVMAPVKRVAAHSASPVVSETTQAQKQRILSADEKYADALMGYKI